MRHAIKLAVANKVHIALGTGWWCLPAWPLTVTSFTLMVEGAALPMDSIVAGTLSGKLFGPDCTIGLLGASVTG